MKKFIAENKLRSVVGIKFVPSYKVEYDKVFKKGTKVWFKLLGRIPLYKHKLKEDKYVMSEFDCLATPTWYSYGVNNCLSKIY